MTIDEQKQVLREQREGFETFRRLELEANREMTFEDRLQAFNRITALSPYLHRSDRTDDEHVARTWAKIHERYDATSR